MQRFFTRVGKSLHIPEVSPRWAEALWKTAADREFRHLWLAARILAAAVAAFLLQALAHRALAANDAATAPAIERCCDGEKGPSAKPSEDWEIVASVPLSTTLSASEFGLAFVNSAETNSGTQRIQRAVETGALMDRFPLYWEQVEKRYGQFTWTSQDNAINANEAQGLDTLAILLGTPRQYRSSGPALRGALGGSFVQVLPEQVRQPVGCDPQEVGGECDVIEVADISASQTPSPFEGVDAEDPIHPELRAQSGTCAAQQGPPAPFGLWNPIFNNGSDEPSVGTRLNPTNPWARFVGAAVQRYKPGGDAGTAIRHWEIWNEPDLCHFWSGTPQEYARLVKVAYIVIKNVDPDAYVVLGGLAHFANGQWLYDMLDALNADALSDLFDGFFDAAGSHHYSLSYVGFQYTRKVRTALDRRGWAHKPIWITESGVPVCDDYPGPTCPSPWRATPVEQASYIWQNIAYTRLAGGGPIFHFMLHDDCGNVVAVDSPDGFGLAKNESGSFCSPSNAETRLAYSAFKLANKYLTGTEVVWADIDRYRVRRIAFYHPETKERRLLTWALTAQAQTGQIPATGTGARLVRMDGSELAVTPTNGIYQVGLAGATNRNWPDGQGGYSTGIYGEPVMFIEQDTLPPTATILDLPAYSQPSFPVTWRVNDWGAGLKSASIWVKVDDGAWELWQENVDAYGREFYNGESGLRYRFSVEAEDLLGYRLEGKLVLGDTTVAVHSAVSGRVIDPAGGNAVGVEVKVGEVTAVTDANGRFSLTAPIGSWNIFVNNQLLIRRRAFSVTESLALLYSPRANAVANGDFESNLSNWDISGSSTSQIEQQPGTSDHALRLASEFVPNVGVPGTEGSDGGNSTVSQRLQVPSGRPYLAFAYRVESEESDSAHDSFEVIAVEDGQPANYLVIQRQSSGWQYRSLDMSQFAGKEITLIFNVYETSPHRRTSAFLDVITLSDVPVQGISSSGTAAPAPTLTPALSQSPEPTLTPALSQSPEPTLTPVATQSPEPTPTPVAIRSPAPGPTPTPTQTPEPTLTQAPSSGLRIYLPLIHRGE